MPTEGLESCGAASRVFVELRESLLMGSFELVNRSKLLRHVVISSNSTIELWITLYIPVASNLLSSSAAHEV